MAADRSGVIDKVTTRQDACRQFFGGKNEIARRSVARRRYPISVHGGGADPKLRHFRRQG